MASKYFLENLQADFPIVDPETGKPTAYFMRLLFGNVGVAEEQEETVETLSEEVTLLSEAVALKADKIIDIAAGFGLSGGGDLSANRVFALGDPALSDPGGDRILYWDSVAGELSWLTIGTNLSITGGVLNAAGGGGGGTPVIRGTLPVISFNSSSVVVAWPTGTVAGDVVFLITAHGWPASAPAGWTTVDNQAGSFVNGAVFQKTMTAGDITAGSVTVNYGGSFNGTIQAVAIEGATFTAVRSTNAIRSSSGATSVAFDSGASDAADLIIGYFGNRAASTNALPAGWTSLSAVNATDGSSVFGSIPGVSGTLMGTATASSAGSGYYTAVLSLQG